MSKQSEAKRAQGYVSKAVPQTCKTCQHFRSESVFDYEFRGKQYYRDANLRCGKGGFAVKKMGTCRFWEDGNA